jgi:hypothetical protein
MLIAEFGSPEDARAAIEALEHHGIDGVEIEVQASGGSGRQRADWRTLVHVSGRVGKGILVGALIGAAILAVVGVVLLVVGLPVAAIAALALTGAAIGGTAGAFIGVERGVGMSEAWEETFHEPRASAVTIEVFAGSAAEGTTARRVLEDHRPVSLRETAPTWGRSGRHG